jgi:hypothetical protein
LIKQAGRGEARDRTQQRETEATLRYLETLVWLVLDSLVRTEAPREQRGSLVDLDVPMEPGTATACPAGRLAGRVPLA